MSALKDLSSHAHPGTYAEYSQGTNPQPVSAFLSGLTQISIALLTPGPAHQRSHCNTTQVVFVHLENKDRFSALAIKVLVA